MNAFVSYAQNLEDVLLWRALRDVEHGFYIDVGAHDPIEASVTQAFYERGWCGIDIEPMPGALAPFRSLRSRDVTLSLAAGETDGALTLHVVPAIPGWSTPVPSIAERYRASGKEVEPIEVRVRTLDSICAEHVKGDIHFLKIDVEGHEASVLRGIDLKRWRPWILLVEATEPDTTIPSHQSWEPAVLASGYRFAWFDGLNRYYVAAEKSHLGEALSVQPNVFDQYVSYQVLAAWRTTQAARLAALEAQQRELEARRRLDAVHLSFDRQLAAARQETACVEARLRELEAAPIRFAARQLWRKMKWLARHAVTPASYRAAVARLRSAMASPAAPAAAPVDLPELPRSARTVLQDLVDARSRTA